MRRFLPLLMAIGCAPPDASSFFNRTDVRTTEDEVGAALEFIPVIESAETTLHVALPHATYQPLTDAIIDAYDRNVDVKVVTDHDRVDGAGIQDLLLAGVPLTLADSPDRDGNGESDPVTYFDFNFNTEVSWTSEQVIMSHAFVVADGLRIATATAVGGESDAQQVVVQMTGEEIAEDLITEHNQVFGGSDATALTAYSAQAKSRADVREIYMTDSDAPVEIYFGPQDRVTKRVIDAVYSARSSVRLLTNEIGNEGLNHALGEKGRWGFSVEAIVGPDFVAQRLGRDFSRVPNVTKLQVTDASDVPTIVLIDIEGGQNTVPRAMVITHDLYSADRFYGSTEVVTDQLIDGTLLLFHDKDYALGNDDGSSLQPIIDLYMDHQSRAGAL